MEQARRRTKQMWDVDHFPTNELTDLKPLEVVEKRTSREVTAERLATDDSERPSVRPPGDVVTNTEVLELTKAVQWHDGDGKSHRIDSIEQQHIKHQAQADRPPLARTELHTHPANDEQERRISTPELAQLASEIAELKGQRSPFAVECHQQLPVEREATLHSERLALTRDRELLMRDRALLLRDRELLAAERKQFFLDRTAHTEQRSAQTGDLANTLAAVNRQFGIPVHESHPEIAEVTVPSSMASWKDTPSAIPLDLAALFQFDREPNKVDDSASEYPEILSGESDPTDLLDLEQPIDEIRSQLAKLFKLPSAQFPATTESTAALSQVRPEIELVEEVQSDTETAVDSQVDDPEGRQPSSDDSIEECMARLLARSRSNAATMEGNRKIAESDSKLSAPVTERPTTVHEQAATTSLDLPHELSEPAHKQDKQALRENLQLFRQVAHASARSAVVRHSIRQRNATMTKRVLLVVSLSAASVLLTQNLTQYSAESKRLERNNAEPTHAETPALAGAKVNRQIW
jgi:hypothetical protein